MEKIMNTVSLNEPQLVVSVSDPALLTKLKNAIKMLNGVTAISVVKQKKTGMEEARDDIRHGRVTEYASAEDMFEKLGI